MTLAIHPDRLELLGVCGLDDAEPLLRALIERPGAALELADCAFLHTAVIQVILAGRPRLNSLPRNILLQSLLPQGDNA
ncbi:MAG: hypothetical protein JWN93_2333 [Hyphomicrobiales bacterium]|nr:hypothetical protein [Hyphomicrobiales bacterium]